MSKLAEAVVTLRLDKTKLAADLLGSRRMLTNAVSGMASAAKGVLSRIFSLKTLLGGIIGGMAFRRFVTPFAIFEEEIDKSLAIMKGAVGMEADLEQSARDAAKRFGRTHEEMARSYFYLASAGLDAKKSLAVYNQVATFATAGSFDMAQATDMLTDALSALGWASQDATKYGENMTRLSDLIVKGNTLANTSVSQLAEALMRRGATTMKMFSMDVEEGTAALLAMADKGFAKGAQAGTQFYILMKGLQQVWQTHESAMRNAGIVMYDQQGQFRGLANVLEEFNTYLGDKSPEAQNAFISGALAMDARATAVLRTLMDTSGAIRQYTTELKAAGGTTQQVAEKNMGNLMTVWRRFIRTIQDTTISINKLLKPAYEEVLKLLSEVSDMFTRAFGGSGASGFGKFVQWLADRVKTIRETLRGLSLLDTGKMFVEGIKQYAVALFNIFVEIGKRMGEAIARAVHVGLFNAGVPGVLEPTAETAMTPIDKEIEYQFEKASKSLSEFTDELKRATAFTQLVELQFAKLGGPLTRAGTWLSSLFGGSGATFGTPQTGLSQFGSIATKGGAGFLGALQMAGKSMLGALPAEGAGGDVVNAIRQALGIPAGGLRRKTAWEDFADTLKPLDWAKQWEREMAAAKVGTKPTAWEKAFGEQPVRAWESAGIESMAKTIQDAIFARREDKIQERIAKATEATAGKLDGVKNAIEDIDTSAVVDTESE